MALIKRGFYAKPVGRIITRKFLEDSYDVGCRPKPLCFLSLLSGQAPHSLVGSHDGHPRDLKGDPGAFLKIF
jgi:hypothetical protein